MIDYGAFCYLDVEKTGSSFVKAFLDRHAGPPLEEWRHQPLRRHDRPPEEGGPSAPPLYFVTCRDPAAQWRSLYFFGVSRRGKVFQRVRRDGRFRGLYNGTEGGLNRWLELVLGPTGPELLGERYGPEISAVCGFQTYRFLKLSFRFPMRALPLIHSRDDLLRLYRNRRLHSAVLRAESLADDLAALVRGPLGPHLRDPEAALADLAAPKRVNASAASGRKARVAISPELLAEIRAREWFFHEELGYP
jgi:hypothetical protein